MLELRDRARLAIEPCPQLLLVLRKIQQHQLDRHFAIQHGIDAAEEHTHAAAAHAFDDLITSDLLGIAGSSHTFLGRAASERSRAIIRFTVIARSWVGLAPSG